MNSSNSRDFVYLSTFLIARTFVSCKKRHIDILSQIALMTVEHKQHSMNANLRAGRHKKRSPFNLSKGRGNNFPSTCLAVLVA